MAPELSVAAWRQVLKNIDFQGTLLPLLALADYIKKKIVLSVKIIPVKILCFENQNNIDWASVKKTEIKQTIAHMSSLTVMVYRITTVPKSYSHTPSPVTLLSIHRPAPSLCKEQAQLAGPSGNVKLCDLYVDVLLTKPRITVLFVVDSLCAAWVGGLFFLGGVLQVKYLESMSLSFIFFPWYFLILSGENMRGSFAARTETIWKKAVRSALDKWQTDGKCDWHRQGVSRLVCGCCSCHPSRAHLIVGDVTVMYLNPQLTDKVKPTGRRVWVKVSYWEQRDFKVC